MQDEEFIVFTEILEILVTLRLITIVFRVLY